MIQRSRVVAGALTLLLGPALGSGSARAAVFTVNSVADTLDVDLGDGLCADASGECSLRSAIAETNALSGADTILVPEGVYMLTLFSPFGDLIIQDELTIRGAGASSTAIDGGGVNRVFVISMGNTVPISGVRLQPGRGATGGPHGGGVANSGDLTLREVEVVGNSAEGSGGGVYSILNSLTLIDSSVTGNTAGICGGGVFNGGTMVVRGSTIADNQVLDTMGCGGGGIFTQFDAVMINSTVSGNEANVDGGGILNGGGGLELLNVTIAENTADADGDGMGNGGGLANSGTVMLKNVISAGNTDAGGEGPDCWGTIVSLGYNLIEDGTGCSITGSGKGNIIGQSALLGALGDNGGPTLTHALLSGSPAIDAGDTLNAPPTDQRGFARPMDSDGDGDAVADIGAFEVPDPDCNGNGTPDELDILLGTSFDCNENAFPDECDIDFGMSRDCNVNGIPDECDILDGTSPDDNGNGVIDDCEIPGDFDFDGDVDLEDYIQFWSCVTGQGGSLGPDCEAGDFDLDQDVDLLDFAGFQAVFATAGL